MVQRAWVGTRKGLFELVHQGTGWSLQTVHFLGDPVSAVVVDEHDRTVYCALNLGHFGSKLHRLDPGLQTWQEVACPAYPEKPTDSDDPLEWAVRQIWILESDPLGPGGPLWAGTLPGGLFRSIDRGSSWQLVSSLWDRPERLEWAGGGYDVPGIHSICIHPSQPERMLVGVSCGGVWASDDGARTWRLSAQGMRASYLPPEEALNPNAQDPHRIVGCQADPKTFWCQHHDGIWRSTDGGATWQGLEGISPSSFGFAVAVHPADPDVAWFVPAQSDQCRVPVNAAFVVNCTRDGGRTFTPVSTGLPSEPSYDLVYRHALDVDRHGQKLLVGATSGRLWASHNSGQSWQPVPIQFPPIYTVRIA